MSQLQVRDDRGVGLGGINIRFAPGDGSSESAPFDLNVNRDGTQSWPIWQWTVQKYTLHVNAPQALDYTLRYESRAIEVTHGDDVVIVLKRTGVMPAPTLARLHAAGPMGFENVSGQRVFLAGASAFLLYRDYLDGKDLEPFLATLYDLGCNAVRVFGMCHYIPVNQGQRAFKPQDYGDRYYDAIPAFYDVLGRFGIYGMWTNFPDNGFIMPDLQEQLQHHARVTAQLGPLPGIYELTNEPGAHDFNAIDADKFPEPTAFPSCVGGYGDEFGAELPPPPHWSYGSYHPPRRYPGHILDSNAVNHPFVLKLNKGVVLMEPDRYGSRGNPNVDQARQSAGASRQSTCGSVYHSACGRDGLPFDAETLRSAEAWFGALR